MVQLWFFFWNRKVNVHSKNKSFPNKNNRMIRGWATWEKGRKWAFPVPVFLCVNIGLWPSFPLRIVTKLLFRSVDYSLIERTSWWINLLPQLLKGSFTRTMCELSIPRRDILQLLKRWDLIDKIQGKLPWGTACLVVAGQRQYDITVTMETDLSATAKLSIVDSTARHARFSDSLIL